MQVGTRLPMPSKRKARYWHKQGYRLKNKLFTSSAYWLQYDSSYVFRHLTLPVYVHLEENLACATKGQILVEVEEAGIHDAVGLQ